MNEADRLEKKILSDFKAARSRFELYEKFYSSLSHKASRYLKGKSREYKECLVSIQELILPGVRKTCPACKMPCCKLSTPERSIYVAGSVGGFDITDYLLSRYDSILPDPDYENAERNLCPFWNEGCILPPDCRSYLCIQYFCEELKSELDMRLISEELRKIESILNSFSIAECMV